MVGSILPLTAAATHRLVCCDGGVSALISAEELAAALGRGEVVVVDVQYSLMGPPSEELYAAGHLPSAPHLSLNAALAGQPGAHGRHPLPDPLVLQQALRDCGLHEDTEVVVYDQQTSLASARAWWILRWAGHPQVRVLNGGLDAWRAAGGAVTTEPVHPEVGTITVRPGSVAVLDATGAATMAAQGIMLDVRAAERYRGDSEPIDAVAGHIPGAINLPISELLDERGAFLAAPSLRARLTAAGVHRDTPVGASCGSGVTAAQAVLAMHEAGITAIPYVGSWSEWIADPARPIATGPNP